jgi:hypothetical protein
LRSGWCQPQWWQLPCRSWFPNTLNLIVIAFSPGILAWLQTVRRYLDEL